MGLLLLKSFVLGLDGQQPGSRFRGSRGTLLDRSQRPPEVEGRLQRHTLALVRAMVHPRLLTGLGQGLVAELCPHGADGLRGIRQALHALSRHGVQLADLLPQPTIRQHSIRRQKDIQVRVVRHPVNADVHGHAIGARQPLPKPFRQSSFLVARETPWQGRIDLPGHHSILPAVVGLHGIPEPLTLHGGHARRQEQGKRRHMLLQGVVRREPSAQINHPRGRPIGRCRHRRASLGPPHDGHRQVVERWA